MRGFLSLFYKVLVEKEARSGCEYGTYCDGDDRVFYPEGAKIGG